MKKITKFIVALSFLSCFVACGQGTSSSFSTSEVITGVEILGSPSVQVGKTISLVADVLGSSNDSVTWSSEDENIASVTNEGKVTGVSVGSVNIIATSVEDPSFSQSYQITVTLPKAEELTLIVEGNDNVVLDEKTGYYNAPLGQTFYVRCEFSPSVKAPENISYEISFPMGVSDSNSFTVEIQPDNRGKVNAFETIKGIAIIAKGTYNDNATGAIISSQYFNIYDQNEDDNASVLNAINEFSTIEQENLISSKVTKNIEMTTFANTDKESVSTSSETIEHKSYNNASYTSSVKTSGDETTTTNLYSGINQGTYYNFEYDNENKITNLYENTAVNKQNNYENLSSLYCSNLGDSILYGHSAVLNNLMTSSSTLVNNIVTFGNSYCYAYANYQISEEQIIISSIFKDDYTGTEYDVKLTIVYDDSSRIIEYKFEETATSYIENENKTIDISITKYIENAFDFVYGLKTTDTNYDKRIDINQYYLQSFDIELLSGKVVTIDGITYNYSDRADDGNGELLTKFNYGPVTVTTNNSGLTKYTLSYDKTLMLRIANPSPSTATTKIDMVTSQTSDANQIPNVNITTAGIIAINARKDDDGLSHPGNAIFTFTSKLGYSKSIEVCFVESEITGLLVTNIDSSNDLGTIFENKLSTYFYLNTIPDEARYTFGINVLEGDQDGIELYDYDDNNIYGYPGFSYSILGKKEGTYKFNFYVKEATYITSETYTITIEKPYSVEEFKEKLVTPKSTFTYNTGTAEFSVEFTSETTLTFVQTIYSETISQTINYHFEEGSIIIDETQVLSADGSYFGKIQAGEILFNKDLSQITLFLQTTDQGSYDITSNTFTGYSFKLKIDVENLENYLNNKTLSSESYIYGVGMSTVSLSFKDGEGSIVIISNTDNTTLVTITFNYSFNQQYNSFDLSNIEYSDKTYSLSYIDYLSSSSEIQVTMYINGDRTRVDFSI